uniref:ADP,ATP carrier protein n=1 Tax=Neobodo designis TaxID=312471 RepID=A0A7S1MIN8_NEODS|mmetsp:Transcript_41370/g.127888  ORF Transcript_41370/g.127888 Transcript_41370/m.127888 type:complete len:306 (+) Transcript_41370:112-1029(+)|eukprot:CAMPEP_0174850438 /NCGR_PEP_ID=MMETSP1114-20130205/19356_1 /TAXON_ID=312471 /ORGANISM="Neobodo designis, Strain CCAP 1951/1" /LENGTH=305 /DNA_ID=CAMNT_0016084899 /DNA_START=105 /DNA_END=1022 /DNA_ORIENTATION=+
MASGTLAQDEPELERPVVSPALRKLTRDGGYLMVKEVSGKTVAIDIATGLAAPMVVAPIIAVVDTSIIQAVMTKTSVTENLKTNATFLCKHPIQFARDKFWRRMTGLCWMVYAGTYASSNIATSYIEANELPANQSKVLKVAAGGAANIGLTLVKDVIMVGLITERFGEGAIKERKRVPMLSRGCFLVRDGLTMMAAFVIGDEVGRRVYHALGDWVSARTARQIGNLVTPVALQPVSTVFHLGGLNYADNQSLSAGAMTQAIRNSYFASTGARMGRILPAVGVGNNINIALRDATYRYAERTRWL